MSDPFRGEPRVGDVRTVADALRGAKSARPVRRVRAPGAATSRPPRVGAMRAWINGDLLPDPSAPAVGGDRPRAHRRGRGLRGGQGGRRPPVRPDPAPRAAGPLGARAGAAGGRRRPPYAGGSRRCSAAGRCRWAGSGSPTPAGPAPLGSGRGRRRRRRWSWSPTPMGAWPETTAVATVPWPRNERGRAGRPQDHVVRRERRRARRGREARRPRGGLRQPRRAPVRGHRHQRLLRRRRRAAHADAGQRLPGRRHPRRWSWSGTAAARSTSRSRSSRGPARSSWSPPPATSRASRAGTTASCRPRAGHRRGRRRLARARARAAGRVSEPGRVGPGV